MTKSPNTFYDSTKNFSSFRNRPNDCLVVQMRDLPPEQVLAWAQNGIALNQRRAERDKKPRNITVGFRLDRDEAIQYANDILRWFHAEPELWTVSETNLGVTTYINCINEEDAVRMYDHAADRYPNNLYRIFVQRGYGDMERVL